MGPRRNGRGWQREWLWELYRRQTLAARLDCLAWARSAMRAERLGIPVPADAARRYLLAYACHVGRPCRVGGSVYEESVARMAAAGTWLRGDSDPLAWPFPDDGVPVWAGPLGDLVGLCESLSRGGK